MRFQFCGLGCIFNHREIRLILFPDWSDAAGDYSQMSIESEDQDDVNVLKSRVTALVRLSMFVTQRMSDMEARLRNLESQSG